MARGHQRLPRAINHGLGADPPQWESCGVVWGQAPTLQPTGTALVPPQGEDPTLHPMLSLTASIPAVISQPQQGGTGIAVAGCPTGHPIDTRCPPQHSWCTQLSNQRDVVGMPNIAHLADSIETTANEFKPNTFKPKRLDPYSWGHSHSPTARCAHSRTGADVPQLPNLPQVGLIKLRRVTALTGTRRGSAWILGQIRHRAVMQWHSLLRERWGP